MSEVAIPEDSRPPRRGAAGSVALAERAYSQLKQAIGNLVLQPGKPLTERHISEWLGIGRMPVREALMRLRDEGLVGVVPRRGYFVSAISAEDAREIYEMLEGLEGMAVKLAADRATPEDVARLERYVREQEQALAVDDLDAWVIADERFHDAIIEIARNRRIQKVIEPLNMQLHRLRLFTVRLRPKPTRSVEDHRALVDAIEAKESDRARDIHQAHRAHARGVMIDVIQKYSGLSGGW